MHPRSRRWTIAGPITVLLLSGGAQADDVRQSVVKIFASKSPPNMFRPWEITPPSDSTGTGVIIEDGRILTNAHVVSFAQQIYVQPNESSDKLDATVEFIAEDCDLATLKLDHPEEISDRKPISLAEVLPMPKAKISVLGYPTGGDTLSITEGVVSRIEYAMYHYGTAALRIQVDAAINPGNSGGPGIVDGQITGIVFSRFIEGENIGYLIPAEVIRHFLDDWAKDQHYDGFPKMDVTWATLENPALRRYLKLDKETTGVVVQRVNRQEIAHIIKPWDVVVACDGVSIDNLGMVPIGDGIRVHAAYLVSRKPPGSSVKLTIHRNAERMEIEVPTITKRNKLVQRMSQERPSYFIYGGLVFSPVTVEMIGQSGRMIAVLGMRGSILTKRIEDYRPDPDEELVVACNRILPHKITKGYQVAPLSVVTHVNDHPVHNLRQMIQLIKDCQEDFVVFRFEEDRQEKIVLDPVEVDEFGRVILRNYNIPSSCSEDLEDICP